MRKVIAVSGGIGSGKSVVCGMLRAMGFPVYDCDARARFLMDNDESIKRELVRNFGKSTVTAGNINRKELAKIVFSDSEKLKLLNKLVHGTVRRDIEKWVKEREGLLFIETAILYQSGIDKMVDEVWEVTAPVDIRVLRAQHRDKAPAEEIRKRIASQDDYKVDNPHPAVHRIVNDGAAPLLPQITALL